VGDGADGLLRGQGRPAVGDYGVALPSRERGRCSADRPGRARRRAPRPASAGSLRGRRGHRCHDGAAIVERIGISAGQWSYTQRMPIVPVLDVGLWPLLQLTVLVPAALWAAMRSYRRLT
jgi:hypothetical protein